MDGSPIFPSGRSALDHCLMWLDFYSRTLIDAGIANAILLSLVAVLMVFTRQPARRVLLAQSGIYASLLMLPLVALSPLPRFYPGDWLVRNGMMPPQFIPRTSQYATDDLLGRRFRDRVGDVGREMHSETDWPAGEPWIRMLARMHLAGMAIGIGWFALGLWGFRRLLKRSSEPSESTRAIFDELVADLDRPPPNPRLRTSTWLRRPVLGGLVEPFILIPARFDDDVSPASLRLILLHELAHADRGDVWFGTLASLSQSIWFFLPHVWWLRSQLRIDQEFLADRKAAGPIGDSAAYARWLIGLASARSVAPDAQSTPVVDAEFGESDAASPWWKGGFKSPLLQRVAMLLYCPFQVEEHPPRWFSISTTLLLAGLTLGVSVVRVLAPIDPSALLQQASAESPLISSLHVPNLVLVPSAGRVFLPLALPPRFQLRADLYATPSAMAQIQVAGHHLVDPDVVSEIENGANGENDTPGWHKIYLKRDARRLILEVDDQPVPARAPDQTSSLEWLTISPPTTTTGRVRDLVVTW